eukprot:TRINITY_DN202_c0_g1_i6.p1 TRINITY_DN202_c0_g1~~TRINITY_DN202_c0_g1_i6.p1  ORF type:complete len:406 (+),score=116.24 TRINITY_DN202_c0_g1_i6:201-1418(+)
MGRILGYMKKRGFNLFNNGKNFGINEKKIVFNFSSVTNKIFQDRVKTGVLMMNMGGPESLEEVKPFLTNLFTDEDIIKLPFLQKQFGALIAKRRAPEVTKLYSEIGGKSPITDITRSQAKKIETMLDEISPESKPHKCYIGFRYAGPLTRNALVEMKNDGVERAIAFSQYPQFSCTTTGSSLNDLWRNLKSLDMEDQFKWSIIDRWPSHPLYIEALKNQITKGLEKNYHPDDIDKVHILFSAHSLPLSTVFKGDQYYAEVAATVFEVMKSLKFSNRYMLVWQSQVGPKQWLKPGTDQVIKDLGKKGVKNVLVVPVAFTTDHIETLSEIDIEFAEIAEEYGVTNFNRSESLNDGSHIVKAMSHIVKEHLENNTAHTKQYKFRCPTCKNPICRTILNPISDKQHQNY